MTRKTKGRKKLSLKREPVRKLNETSLERAGGGNQLADDTVVDCDSDNGNCFATTTRTGLPQGISNYNCNHNQALRR